MIDASGYGHNLYAKASFIRFKQFLRGDDNIKKVDAKVFIRTNFVRPDSGQNFHQLTYKFDPMMELDVLYVRNLLFAYFGLRRNMYLEIGVSMQKLLKICGSKGTQDYKRTAMYRFIKEALQSLVDDGFIEPLKKSISNYSLKEYLEIQLVEENFYMSVRRDDDKRIVNEPFFSISTEEFSKIQSLNRCNVPKLFYIYCYIKSRIRFRRPGTDPQIAPRMYFESTENIAERFNISYSTAWNYMVKFCQIGLLKAGSLTTTAKGWKPPKVYVLNEEGWEMELRNAISYLDSKRKNNENQKGT